MERTGLLSLLCCLAILYFEVDGKGKNAKDDTDLLQGSDEQLSLLEKSDAPHLRNIRSAEYKKTYQKNQNNRGRKIKEKAKKGKKLQVRKGKTRNTKKKGNKNRNKINITKRKMKDKKNKPPKNTKNKSKIKNKKIKSKKGKNGSNSRQSTCQTTATQVSDQCLEDARVALVYEANQVKNFQKQANRLDTHQTVGQNKLSKKDEFKSAAKHMLWAVGGNLSDPKCGESTNDSTRQERQNRELTTAISNYYKLINCSDSIHAACDLNLQNETYNHADHSEKLTLCRKLKADFQNVTAECFDNTQKKKNATVQCECWGRAAVDVARIKKEKCNTKSQQVFVTNHKKDCVAAFIVCKKLEDAAVELVHTCMHDHSNHLINQTAQGLHDAAEAAGKKSLPGGSGGRHC
eukprot:GFUD01008232.1.p1 GENE.GFUD01008232.1~~GFUD01008232.1.p1  ORF type:complete len:404 (-),score=96.54 GFUD01008232.1:108-1319(-)